MNINGYNLNLTDEIKYLLNNYQDYYYPSYDNVFRAFNLTAFNDVKVVFIGQDAYPNKDDACGLAFSVNRDKNLPKSLINIFKALEIDLNITRTDGDLSSWAKQGVLLLNTCLTYNSQNPKSHLNIGWQDMSNNVITSLSNRGKVIFVLLGNYALSFKKLINEDNNTIISAPHPSPLSVYRGFFDAHIFNKINDALIKYNYKPIDWN